MGVSTPGTKQQETPVNVKLDVVDIRGRCYRTSEEGVRHLSFRGMKITWVLEDLLMKFKTRAYLLKKKIKV